MFFVKTNTILKNVLPRFLYFYIDEFKKIICKKGVYWYNIAQYSQLPADMSSNFNCCVLHQFWLHKEQRGVYGL